MGMGVRMGVRMVGRRRRLVVVQAAGPAAPGVLAVLVAWRQARSRRKQQTAVLHIVMRVMVLVDHSADKSKRRLR